MKFSDLLKEFNKTDKAIKVTLGDEIALTCKIMDIQDDFVKVNLLAFNKATRSFDPTSNFYYVPIASMLFVEELKR
ncbi:MAG: hypothetical protein V1913_01660 [Fibrobacterota bacterium]